MTQQDTQPPAETLAEAREAAALTFDARARKAGHPATAMMERHHAKVIRAGEGDDYDAVQAALIALTRRAGGDAIPAGMSAVMGRILGHYSEDPGTLARIKGMVAQYREAPFRSAEWLAGEIMRILDSEPANDTTPKPPAGGDAGVKP